MKWLVSALLILALAAAAFAMLPSPVDSVAWTPPEAPAMTGPLAANQLLQKADLLARGEVYGPEDTAVDAQGRLYAGTQDGKVVRLWPDSRLETWVETGGRPLGMVFDEAGRLIVADSYKGLLAISPDARVEVLATSAGGVDFGFTDDVAIAPDGRIYFSDASSRFHQPDYLLDLFETRPHGRLLRHDPVTGETEVLLDDLYFANGVAVAPQGDYVLVNETWKYRITRYWIEGERKGEAEVFIENLPGFPDNLAVDEEGRYWVALPTLRNPQIDAAHPKPWLKEMIAKLPDFLQPPIEEYGLVIALNPNGEIVTSLHDPSGQHLQEITSVNPHKGVLYFGSLHNDRIGRLPFERIPGIGD
ncbi:SMP-30/gluconolactonase/LRE family protein [Marinobacter salicampi]|uniref:SMP-30/gluconolactonase/LRE family protein n=1 Tax=Marinobacter salicampi TaxID=435907 RepID=UPI0014076A33|nr:SMP-30/gluconolactonase/LRE family protein [Marinobacter salicampi]